MEGSIIFYTYGSTLELNGQQFEAGRLTEDLLNLSPDDYHPLHERMVRIRMILFLLCGIWEIMHLAERLQRHSAAKKVDLPTHTAVILSFQIQFFRQEYSTGMIDTNPQLHIIQLARIVV